MERAHSSYTRELSICMRWYVIFMALYGAFKFKNNKILEFCSSQFYQKLLTLMAQFRNFHEFIKEHGWSNKVRTKHLQVNWTYGKTLNMPF